MSVRETENKEEGEITGDSKQRWDEDALARPWRQRQTEPDRQKERESSLENA